MTTDVLCLRPESDFARVGVAVPAALKVAYAAPDVADLAERIAGARAMVIPAVGPKLPAALFADARLQLVQVTGAGLDRLDRAAMEARGIPVANVPGGSNGALAEYAIASALMLLRRFAFADAEIRRGRYAEGRAKMIAENAGGLEGLLVGVVGLGVIGAAVAAAFRRMGARIAYYDPALADPGVADALEARAMPLADLLSEADVVTLHVPLMAATQNLIDAAALARMKPTAVLLQASRGGIVDEAALAAALAEGRIAGAAVDVYSAEPPPADHPLLALSGEAAGRLILTPHIAGVSRQASATLFRVAWENVERVLLKGEPPRHRVY